MDARQLELYQHPLWVIKRNKIFKRDGYRCTVCGSKKKLCVHHTFYYDTFPPPWEYADKSLITLCGKCHYGWHCQNEILYKSKKIHKRKRVHKEKKVKRHNKTLAKKVLDKKKRQEFLSTHVKIGGKWYVL